MSVHSAIILTLLTFAFPQWALSDAIHTGNSCKLLFASQSTQFQNSFLLPQFTPRLLESEIRVQYVRQNYKLKKELHSNSKEEQIKLVQELRTKAINDVALLLMEDADLKGLPKKSFFVAAERNVDWREEINALDIAKYELLLVKQGINPNSKPKSLAAIFKNFDYPSLIHRTKISNLLSILSQGQIVSRQQGSLKQAVGGGGEAQYVYLEAYPKRFEPRIIDPKVRREHMEMDGAPEQQMFTYEFKSGNVYLEIDSSVIDVARFSHWNLEWAFGDKIPETSVSPTYSVAAALNSINRNKVFVEGYQPRNELLFTGAVPIHGLLKGIHVHPHEIEKTKKALREAGISEEYIKLVK